MIASVGSTRRGSSRSSTRTSPGPCITAPRTTVSCRCPSGWCCSYTRSSGEGRALVDQRDDAVADDLRFREPERASLGCLLEGLLARPEDHRKDHQVDLVHEVGVDEVLHEPVTARHLQLAVELLLELTHLSRRVAAVEDRRVAPLGVLERRRDDELRHGVELVGELAFAVRPGAGEALIGAPSEQQRVGAPGLLELELVSVVTAVELERPPRVLEVRFAAWRLHHAV